MKNYYDIIAKQYDSLFIDNKSKMENEIITNIIKKNISNEMVVDIGCGTGLLLDYIDIKKNSYCGIDPSEEMLKIFKRKHKGYCVKNKKLEEFKIEKENVFYVSLFGAISYVDIGFFTDWFNKERHKKHLLMFYKDGYYPKTYKKTGIDVRHNKFRDFFCEDYKEFGNYAIVTNLKLEEM